MATKEEKELEQIEERIRESIVTFLKTKPDFIFPSSGCSVEELIEANKQSLTLGVRV